MEMATLTKLILIQNGKIRAKNSNTHFPLGGWDHIDKDAIVQDKEKRKQNHQMEAFR